MMLFSKRRKLADKVEREMKRDEREHNLISLSRCHLNTVSYLDRMGWLRDKPQRKPKS